MKRHPYEGMGDYAFWRRAVAQVPDGQLDPVVKVPFVIGPQDKVATAGSCFAQHIGRYLKASGANYFVAEPAHPLLGPAAAQTMNYGVYTARYGNIYTARQLLQLFDRAYGEFAPKDDIWRESATVYLDPFRPTIQPGGFNSEREFAMDRERHFAAVRTMFAELDVFVFTLGLTEAWRAKDDGAIYPVCPGVSGGAFSSEQHEFVNFEVEDIVADLRAFRDRLRSVNRKARVILTVSPVPLAATGVDRHVLTSTVYSKSVLRVACEKAIADDAGTVYFPSYEIVASGFAGSYFAADKRSVTEAGVAHVMQIFARHMLRGDSSGPLLDFVRRTLGVLRAEPAPVDAKKAAIEAALRVMCDEEALDAAIERSSDASRPT